VIAAVLLHAAPAVAADDDEAPDAPIIVTGRGLEETPATPAYDVQEIDRERITRSASGRIEDVLSQVAGFQQFRRSDSRSSNPSAQGVTLRALGGNATSRALVLLDGVPMADPFFGYIPLSAISPEGLEAVRVTRGGGSGAFGSGAVAGTIEMISADADTLGLIYGTALVNGRGDTESVRSIAPKLGQGFAVASWRWDRGQGFWTTPKSQRVPASVRAKYGSWSASLRGVAPLNDTVELQARIMAYNDERTLRFDGADTASEGQDASIRLVGRGDWQFDALGYVQNRDFSNIVISSTSFRKTLDQRRTPSTGIGGKLELRPPVGEDHVLRLGADWRHAVGEMQEEPYSAVTGLVTARRRAGGSNDDMGLFVEDDWTLGKLVLTGGLRADRWSIRDGFFREANAAGTVLIDKSFDNRSGWNTSLRGGGVWKAGGGFALRGAAYTGTRLPTLNELYRPFTVFPVTTRANANLKNEKLRGFELGVDFAAADNLNLSATVFDNKVKDAVANVTIGTNLRERQNVEAVHAQGVELTADLRLGQFSLDGSLAWTDAEVEQPGSDINGMRPAQTPKVAASGTVAWRPKDGWIVSGTVRHTGMQFEDDLQTDKLPAATTFDAYAEIPVIGPFSLMLRGENLTDEKVVTRNQGGSMDLGAPLTVWAGVKLRLERLELGKWKIGN
jgi:outer membrane receptor protein involved in Fe transport